MRGVGLAAALVLAATAAGCAGDETDEGAAPPVAECAGAIGFMGPITGDAASIGREQLSFARFAVQRYNEENGTAFGLEEGDTQLDPGRAATVAQRFVSNSDVLAVVGPAGNQEVEAVGPVFTRAGLGFVSASATRTSLTESGDLPTFFRVVPNDGAQGPTIGSFIADQLEVGEVLVIDDRTAYSTGLADSAIQVLEQAGVTVRRDSVGQEEVEFSALVSRVGGAEVVFLPWELAARAQEFGRQLREQGGGAVIFGSDRLFSEDFSIEGSYVSSFAPDIRGIDRSLELVEAYEQDFGRLTSTFGPPVYAAALVALEAVERACEGRAATREAVAEEIGRTNQSRTILGRPIRFDENGDVEGARFFVFQVQGEGEYELVE